MITKDRMVIISFMIMCHTACAFPKADVLECGLPDGSKFVLTSKYDYSLFGAAMSHIGDVSDEQNRESFDVKFKLKGILDSVDFGNYPYDVFDNDLNIGTAHKICATAGMFNGSVYFGAGYLFSTRTMKRINFTWNKKLSDETLEKQYFDFFHQKKGGLSNVSLTQKGNKILYEQSIVSYDANCAKGFCKVIKVIQSTSEDNGRNWSDPIITGDAKMFELGKSIYEQSFIARPISINGKKTEAHFPPQKAQ